MSIDFEKYKKIEGEIRQSAEILKRIGYIEKIVSQLDGETILSRYLLHPTLEDALKPCFDDPKEHIEGYRHILIMKILDELADERQSLISKVCAIREHREDEQ